MSTASALKAEQGVQPGTSAYPSLVHDLLKMAGDDNVVLLSPAFVRFTGTLEAALLLSQLLYWHPRTKNPGRWIYKTDGHWSAEICLPKYSIREARLRLETLGIIRTRVKRANGSPTVHYQCDLNRLTTLWKQFLSVAKDEWDQGLKGVKDAIKKHKESRKGARAKPPF
jgi:hypothetical protein